ncbi:50S ribosomal protein L11 methyltransferase [Solirubrobacter soli]|uniref:50S ribosomal protein L11 methyltransferase n=1 Tax=Solirubrobacter soli TaxID=363832 RepID=UPI0003FDD51E|nr:50S ribosomal protein L11 methyltransferase [Solirubrobacter soli]
MNRLGIRVRAEDAELAFARLEPVLAGGAEEVELDDLVEFAVYGDTLPTDEALRALAGDTLVDVVRSEVSSGWASAWQSHLTPVVAGGFTVRPPWLDGALDDLVIDPGPSFGAASHPTTRLCLELLRESPPSAVADWGCGSGVLAIAAARLGFAPVCAVELDPAAAHTARRNAARNAVDVDVTAADVTTSPPWAPTITANLTLPLLVATAASLRATASPPAVPGAAAPRVAAPPAAPGASASSAAPGASAPPAAAPPAAPGASASPVAAASPAAASPTAAVSPGPTRLIASGFLATAADEVVAAWGPLGFTERDRRTLDGWAALVLER